MDWLIEDHLARIEVIAHLNVPVKKLGFHREEESVHDLVGDCESELEVQLTDQEVVLDGVEEQILQSGQVILVDASDACKALHFRALGYGNSLRVPEKDWRCDGTHTCGDGLFSVSIRQSEHDGFPKSLQSVSGRLLRGRGSAGLKDRETLVHEVILRNVPFSMDDVPDGIAARSTFEPLGGEAKGLIQKLILLPC